MNLNQAMASSIEGLNVTQSGMALIAANVANANTPGYVEKTQALQTTTSADGSVGVDVASVNRQLNTQLQSQLRTESSGGAYADLASQIYQQLQSAYGSPSASTSLSSTYANFTGALQTLQSDPSSYSDQSAVVGTAQALTSQLNSLTFTVQTLRTNCEQGLASSVTSANNLLQSIANLNSQVASSPNQNAATQSLLDQRDSDIDQLANLMDIRVVQGSNNQVTVFTSSGLQLAGTTGVHAFVQFSRHVVGKFAMECQSRRERRRHHHAHRPGRHLDRSRREQVHQIGADRRLPADARHSVAAGADAA